ncbi:MAG: FadR/GntR family transcriptional regulator [Woeseiaceae bacterium]|nr:FadR/GntR family transcriptional regulator [Woeseiaceae bacterium]
MESSLAINLGVFQPARGMTLSSQIVAQIRAALFAGDLKPGDVLGSEGELARQFGVSRMSVRDALRSLEAMGIVDIRMGAKGGATIANGSGDRFADSLAIQLKLIGVTREDILEARAGIESMTVAMAAMHGTREDLDRLRGLLDEAETHLDDPERSAHLGEEFHLAIAEATGNQVMISQLKAMREVLMPPAQWPDHDRAQRMLDVHSELFGLIEKGDACAARDAMVEHVRHWIT